MTSPYAAEPAAPACDPLATPQGDRGPANVASASTAGPRFIRMVNGMSGAWAMFDFAAFTLGCEWTVELIEGAP